MDIIKNKLSHLGLNLNLYDNESIFNICRYRHYKTISSDEDNRLAIIGGAIFAQGSNKLQQLGSKSDDYDKGRYLQFPSTEIPKLVSLDIRTSYILTESVGVYRIGYDKYDQYTTLPTLIEFPEKIIDTSTQNNISVSLFLSNAGNVCAEGPMSQISCLNVPNEGLKLLPGFSNIIKFVAMDGFLLALDKHGDIYALGGFCEYTPNRQR